MLDHIIFNKLKWFNIADNVESVNANNRVYYTMPRSFSIPANVDIIFSYGGRDNNDSDIADINFSPQTTHQNGQQMDNIACIGIKAKNSTIYYLFNSNVPILNSVNHIEWVTTNGEAVVKASDVKNVIWGGKSFLFAVVSMVKRAFTQFKKGAETC